MTVEHDHPPRTATTTTRTTMTTKHDGVRGSLAVVVGHSRDPGDSIDEALTADARGIRVVKVSLAVLAATAAADLLGESAPARARLHPRQPVRARRRRRARPYPAPWFR